AARSADHDTRATSQRAPPAQSNAPAPPARGEPSTPPPPPRAPRNAARPACTCSPRPAADRRGTRAGRGDRTADQQARPATAQPTRNRPTARRPDRALLVTPRPPRKRGRLRQARRRRPDPRLLGPDDPLPARPRR